MVAGELATVYIEEGMLAIGKDFTVNELPKINVIERIDRLTEKEKIKSKFEYLKNKKVLLIYGQDNDISEDKIKKVQTEMLEAKRQNDTAKITKLTMDLISLLKEQQNAKSLTI